MNKITLANKEYELPEINFGAMRKLGNLGFKFDQINEIQEKPFNFISIMVAFITDSTIEEADEIIDNSFKTAKEFNEMTEKLVQWFADSDFFKKMQAD